MYLEKGRFLGVFKCNWRILQSAYFCFLREREIEIDILCIKENQFIFFFLWFEKKMSHTQWPAYMLFYHILKRTEWSRKQEVLKWESDLLKFEIFSFPNFKETAKEDSWVSCGPTQIFINRKQRNGLERWMERRFEWCPRAIHPYLHSLRVCLATSIAPRFHPSFPSFDEFNCSMVEGGKWFSIPCWKKKNPDRNVRDGC